MADHRTVHPDIPSTAFLVIDAIVFWVRSQTVFWLAVLPIAGLAAIVAWLLDANQQFADFRNPWGWHFLFALIYAMFLDRWMKETLLEDAAPCDEVDALRRSIVDPRFLAFAACFFVLAMMLGTLEIEGIAGTLARWGTPPALTAVGSMVLSWLPHLLVWTALMAILALSLPAYAAGKPLSPRRASALGRPLRGTLFALVFGAALLSLIAHATTAWGLQVLPKKPWAPAAMAGALRLFDCLLLALLGHALATVWRQLTGWEQPEPEDRPFRGMQRHKAV